MPKLLLALLRAYLTLGVDPPDEPDPPEGDPPVGDPPVEDDELPNLEDDEPPAGEGDDEDPAAIRAQLKAERTAREAAERQAREASDRAAAAERARAASPPAKSEEQRIFEEEEARLRAADVTAQEKWQIESNRVLRANTRASTAALNEAREISDRADFERLKASTPVLKKYESRIEAKLVEIRATGSNLPRRVVAQLLIGEDIVSGKVKSTKRAAGDGAPASGGARVERGKPPSGRSDVRGRGAQSEHDKRKARLENQII